MKDLREALITVPDARTWLVCAAVYAVFVVSAGSIGLLSGLLRPSAPHLPLRDMLLTALVIVIQPALVEEMVFRGLLLPREADALPRRRLLVVAGAALALYVASHPLNAWLFRPEATVFANPVYLVLATLLGLTCTLTYFISRSLWPPVAIHWLAVLTWLWFLGGAALIKR